jgi:hypothetical protein
VAALQAETLGASHPAALRTREALCRLDLPPPEPEPEPAPEAEAGPAPEVEPEPETTDATFDLVSSGVADQDTATRRGARPAPAAGAPSSFQARRTGTLKEIWKKVDKDKSGALDADEIHAVLLLMGRREADIEIDRVMKAIDKDGSGTVDFAEFEIWWKWQGEGKQATFQENLEAASLGGFVDWLNAPTYAEADGVIQAAVAPLPPPAPATSLDRPFVRRELDLAASLGKPIVVVYEGNRLRQVGFGAL